MRFRIRWISLLLAIVALLTLPGAAAAQQRGSDGIIRLEVTTIEGRVQKPNAFFINTRSSTVYEGLEIRESFIEEIIKVVETGDF